MFANLFVHEWLRSSWFIGFAVSLFAITNHVNDDVFLEFITEIQSQLCNKHQCLRIIAVHMKDRRLNHLRHIGAVKC